MITREDVKDLRPGDLVEIVRRERITVEEVTPDGRVYPWIGDGSDSDIESLTVVSRAPRPLFVNSDRTEPIPGDVVRDADDDTDTKAWIYTVGGERWRSSWMCAPKGCAYARSQLPDHLRLLVDGTTGQAVAP